MALLFTIKAKNSSGRQFLHVDVEDGEICITITGEYEGSKFQYDFDGLSYCEAIELSDYIRMKANEPTRRDV